MATWTTAVLCGCLILVTTCWAQETAGSVTCPPGWVVSPQGQYCYHLFRYKINYINAVSLCSYINGTLVTPKNEQQTLMIANLTDRSAAWIGLNDIKNENNFVWIDGQTLNGWENWGLYQPNNRRQPNNGHNNNDENQPNDENCVSISFSSARWFDLSCSLERYVVCQVAIDVVRLNCHLDLPPEDGHHDLASSTIALGSHVTYDCRQGYYALSGPVKRTCLINGRLSGDALERCIKDCPTGWKPTPLGKYCYKYFAEAVDHDTAASRCREMGAALADTKTPGQIEVFQSFNGTEKAWIGLNDIETEGEFKWGDGTSLSWENWGRHQPNNDREREHCVAVSFPDGKWFDEFCGRSRHIVCQISPNLTMHECSLNSIMNGSVLSNSTSVPIDSTVTYACEEGYAALRGSRSRTCMVNGEMSGEPLGCFKKCPGNWTLSSSGQYCYYFYSNELTYSEAVSKCGEMSGTLPTPKTVDDNNILHSIVSGDGRLWIGLKDIYENQTFVWSDNEQLNGWSNWENNRPNGGICVAMTIFSGKWADVYCERGRKFACQVSIDVAKSECLVDTIANGVVDPERDTVQIGSTVSYSCDDNYVTVSGSTSRTCMVDGELSGDQPVCGQL